jgi:hypothetical protein
MDLLGLEQFIRGAVALGSATIALFFFRFWHSTRDRLFLFFALCFLLLSLIRIGLAIVGMQSEVSTYLYFLRFLAFVLLIFAIIHKNREEK